MIVILSSTFLFFSAANLSPAQKAMKQYEASFSIRQSGRIEMLLSEGGVIVLDNGSKWAVAPEDIEETSGWIGAAKVEIAKGPHPDARFPFLMYNTVTKKVVSVRRLEN